MKQLCEVHGSYWTLCVCLALNILTLVFRFNVIFNRCFGGRFHTCSEHLWCHMNEEVADFITLTFQREMGMAIDVLHTGYHPSILMYMLDEIFFVYKKMQMIDDLDVQHMVAFEILR